jgi:Fe-S-cluster-containing dehydrogenase component
LKNGGSVYDLVDEIAQAGQGEETLMARYGMVFDLKRCIGCNACVIACKQENSLPDGVFFTRTLSEEYGVYPAVNRVYIPTLCNHCEDAPCEKVCPSGATWTRPDGIVMVDPEKCIGCGSCAVACPYDQRSEMKAEKPSRTGCSATAN